jgi:hypothetical protein
LVEESCDELVAGFVRVRVIAFQQRGGVSATSRPVERVVGVDAHRVMLSRDATRRAGEGIHYVGDGRIG